MQRAAHTIKGAIGYCSAQSVYDTAFHLETLGQQANFGEATTAFDNLLVEFRQLESELYVYLQTDIPTPV